MSPKSTGFLRSKARGFQDGHGWEARNAAEVLFFLGLFFSRLVSLSVSFLPSHPLRRELSQGESLRGFFLFASAIKPLPPGEVAAAGCRRGFAVHPSKHQALRSCRTGGFGIFFLGLFVSRFISLNVGSCAHAARAPPFLAEGKGGKVRLRGEPLFGGFSS